MLYQNLKDSKTGDWKEEIEILYHGTKFKYVAEEILKEGFEPYTYFSTDLNTALGHGGKYVFEVAFLKKELPDFWQVRCENAIPTSRIIRLSRLEYMEIIKKVTIYLFTPILINSV